jgi:hypothetical protein
MAETNEERNSLTKRSLQVLRSAMIFRPGDNRNHNRETKSNYTRWPDSLMRNVHISQEAITISNESARAVVPNEPTRLWYTYNNTFDECQSN